MGKYLVRQVQLNDHCLEKPGEYTAALEKVLNTQAEQGYHLHSLTFEEDRTAKDGLLLAAVPSV